jgi:AmmeMemoRadiSam system protein A
MIMAQSSFASLAKNTIETYIRENRVLEAPSPVPPDMKDKAGVFVSLKKGGALRGCIGTFEPTTDSIAHEIIRNAIAASTQDPRFSAVREDELGELEISVDVLTKPEKVASTKDLNAKKYGVIVAAERRKGLLLPDLEGVNTPEEQIAICMRKSGIGENDAVQLYRFEVKRYH